MKLMTKEIEAKLPRLYSQAEEKNPKIIVKFFHPLSSWTWYVTEGEKIGNGDWRFFGLVDGHEKELGYFHLSQLEEVKVKGLGVERDMYFGEHWLNEFNGVGVEVHVQTKQYQDLFQIARRRGIKTGRKVVDNKITFRKEIKRAINSYIVENTP